MSAVTGLMGEDPAIVVACPGCGTNGRVHFSQLPRVMHCAQCHDRFWIGRDGKVHSQSELSQVRFACPRCGHQERLVLEFAAGGVSCPRCDARFRSNGEDPGRLADAPTPQPSRQEQGKDGRGRGRVCLRAGWLAAACGCVALLAAIFGWRGARQESLSAVAVWFTQQCLSGDLKTAETRVANDQRDDFQRWHRINFPEARDPTAPPDNGEVSVRDAIAEGSATRVWVIIRRAGKGERMQTQYWRREDGRWRFDAVSTLAAIYAEE